MHPQTTVLIVEDEPLILLAACDMVENAGCIAREAANADIALEILEQDCAIALLFTDIDMPGSMDGMGLVLQVQARWPEMGIIITSGRRPLAPHDVPKRCSFLDKPYLEHEVSEALRKLLE